jgi:hypothetical protein
MRVVSGAVTTTAWGVADATTSTSVPTYGYDVATNTPEATFDAGPDGAAARAAIDATSAVSKADLVSVRVVVVAAEDGLSAADQSALDYATTSSKLEHIFAAKHNFDPLVQQYRSREAFIQQFLTGLKGLTPESGTFEQQILVGGQKVIVRGAVVNGVTKIGTAFTP